jgi:hypothetical protein
MLSYNMTKSKSDEKKQTTLKLKQKQKQNVHVKIINNVNSKTTKSKRKPAQPKRDATNSYASTYNPVYILSGNPYPNQSTANPPNQQSVIEPVRGNVLGSAPIASGSIFDTVPPQIAQAYDFLSSPKSDVSYRENLRNRENIKLDELKNQAKEEKTPWNYGVSKKYNYPEGHDIFHDTELAHLYQKPTITRSTSENIKESSKMPDEPVVKKKLGRPRKNPNPDK